MSNGVAKSSIVVPFPVRSLAPVGGEAVAVDRDGRLQVHDGQVAADWHVADVAGLTVLAAVAAVDDLHLYALDEGSRAWIVEGEGEGEGAGWKARPLDGSATGISAARDGTVWAVEASGATKELVDGVWQDRTTEPQMAVVSVGGRDVAAAVDAGGGAWRWSAHGGSWERFGEAGIELVDIAVRPDGLLWAIDADGQLRAWVDMWFATGGFGYRSVAADGDGRLWLVGTDGSATGVGDPFDAFEGAHAAPAEVMPMWDAEDPFIEAKSTHLWIVNRGARLAADAGPTGKAICDLIAPDVHGEGTPFHSGVCHGLYDADFVPPYNDWGWRSHFYDPDSGTNYRGETSPTALTQGRKFFNRALDLFKGQAGDPSQNYNAGKALGLALHYLTDLTQPMHAANYTALDWPPFYHTDFEFFVMQRQEKLPINTSFGAATGSTPSKLLIAAARQSKPYLGDVLRGEWDLNKIPVETLGEILSNAINATAQFLVAWMSAAQGTDTKAIPGALVTLGAPQQVAFLHVGSADLHQLECEGHWVDNNLSNIVDRMHPANDPPSALAAWGVPMEQLLFRGRDGQLVEYWYDGGWRATDLTEESGGPKADPDTNFATLTVPGRQLFFVAEADGNIHQLWFDNGSKKWRDTDLTTEARKTDPTVPLPARTTSLAAVNAPYQRVFYIDDAHAHIHVLWNDGSKWRDTDLTTEARKTDPTVPLPEITTALAVLSIHTQVSYVAKDDGNLHALWYDGSKWRDTDLTTEARKTDPKVPPPARDTALATLGSPQQQVFFLSAADMHVHVLWYSNGWRDTDLTAGTKAPPAGPGSALATLAQPQAQQVFYTTDDGGVHQLWYQNGWRHTDLS